MAFPGETRVAYERATLFPAAGLDGSRERDGGHVGVLGAEPGTAVISHAIFFVTLPLVTLSLGFASIDRSLVEDIDPNIIECADGGAAMLDVPMPNAQPWSEFSTIPLW